MKHCDWVEMTDRKQEIADKQIKTVTYLGAAVNVALSVLKIGVGVFAGSLALVADGIHSFSDLATDSIVLLGLRLGSREPDQSHPYGHGRLETFSAGLIALVLVFVGGVMVYYATVAIAEDKTTTPRLAVLMAAVVSVAAKEWLYQTTRNAAVRSHSTALYANAWHHRSDALSSVAVIIGVILLRLGYEHGDQVAAIAVGGMIIWVGIKVLGDCVGELSERAVDAHTLDHIRNIINANPSIRQWHRLRTRSVGREVFVDMHILVDPHLDVAAAHEISQSLEDTLQKEIPRPINITIHIEPDVPSLRR